SPPRGFSAWYTFAVQHAFVIIDEFDAVVEDLAPFWELSGEEMRGRAELVGALPSIDLVRVRGGEADAVRAGDGDSARLPLQILSPRLIILQRLANASPQLPDMVFPINAKAEGRIVMPWQHVAYPKSPRLARTFPIRFPFVRVASAGAGRRPPWWGTARARRPSRLSNGSRDCFFSRQ
ncbi:hypothetical protein B0H14DRAFT_2365339, partial [Mycena olivaceomarginata]